MLSLLRSADDHATRTWNHEPARNDHRRDGYCCGKASAATCHHSAPGWRFSHGRWCHVALRGVAAARLAQFLIHLSYTSVALIRQVG